MSSRSGEREDQRPELVIGYVHSPLFGVGHHASFLGLQNAD